MWYGSEEIGLEGSWAYVKGHKEELENHLLMINVDVGGPVLAPTALPPLPRRSWPPTWSTL